MDTILELMRKFETCDSKIALLDNMHNNGEISNECCGNRKYDEYELFFDEVREILKRLDQEQL